MFLSLNWRADDFTCRDDAVAGFVCGWQWRSVLGWSLALPWVVWGPGRRCNGSQLSARDRLQSSHRTSGRKSRSVCPAPLMSGCGVFSFCSPGVRCFGPPPVRGQGAGGSRLHEAQLGGVDFENTGCVKAVESSMSGLQVLRIMAWLVYLLVTVSLVTCAWWKASGFVISSNCPTHACSTWHAQHSLVKPVVCFEEKPVFILIQPIWTFGITSAWRRQIPMKHYKHGACFIRLPAHLLPKNTLLPTQLCSCCIWERAGKASSIWRANAVRISLTHSAQRTLSTYKVRFPLLGCLFIACILYSVLYFYPLFTHLSYFSIGISRMLFPLPVNLVLTLCSSALISDNACLEWIFRHFL